MTIVVIRAIAACFAAIAAFSRRVLASLREVELEPAIVWQHTGSAEHARRGPHVYDVRQRPT